MLPLKEVLLKSLDADFLIYSFLNSYHNHEYEEVLLIYDSDKINFKNPRNHWIKYSNIVVAYRYFIIDNCIHIEDIQSDWSYNLRKYGALPDDYDIIVDNFKKQINSIRNKICIEKHLIKDLDDLTKKYNEYLNSNKNKVPYLIHVSKIHYWTDLALQSIISKALLFNREKIKFVSWNVIDSRYKIPGLTFYYEKILTSRLKKMEKYFPITLHSDGSSMIINIQK